MLSDEEFEYLITREVQVPDEKPPAPVWLVLTATAVFAVTVIVSGWLILSAAAGGVL